MLNHIAGHVVRRGLEGISSTSLTSLTEDPERYDVPTPFVVIGSITVAIFFIIMWLFGYTYYHLFLTLGMIEQQTASAIVLNDDATNTQERSDEEVLIVKNKPISASLFGLAKHLRATGGRLALYRGLGLYAVTTFIISLIAQLVTGLIPFGQLTVAPMIGAAVASLILARWLMAWTHIVISEPSPLPWWRRIPSSKTWLKILPATLLYAVARQLSIALPLLAAVASKLAEDVKDPANMNGRDARVATGKGAYILLISILANALLVVPAHFVLVRTHASLLPEETESIVPYDRSYNGKVVPEIVGGKGCLSVTDAFKTIDRSSIRRLLTMYLKIFALQILVGVCFVVSLGIEIAVAIPHLQRRAPKDGEIHD